MLRRAPARSRRRGPGCPRSSQRSTSPAGRPSIRARACRKSGRRELADDLERAVRPARRPAARRRRDPDRAVVARPRPDARSGRPSAAGTPSAAAGRTRWAAGRSGRMSCSGGIGTRNGVSDVKVAVVAADAAQVVVAEEHRERRSRRPRRRPSRWTRAPRGTGRRDRRAGASSLRRPGGQAVDERAVERQVQGQDREGGDGEDREDRRPVRR